MERPRQIRPSSQSPLTPLRVNTASSLLAKFLPKDKPFVHKMARSGSQTYQTTSSASSPASTLPNSSPYPMLSGSPSAPILLDDEEDDIQYVDRRPRSRQPNIIVRGIQRPENHHRSTALGRSSNKKSSLVSSDIDELAPTPHVSDRSAIRQKIAIVTTARRNRFFIEKRDYFLPLLPDQNYIKKLVDKDQILSPAEHAKLPTAVPYEEIEAQPIGVKATMKPYQLSGVSFLLYLHRNGLSGILGDEMGLGKTLQTLSLIQYLKENEPTIGSQNRPFLVICPLSVLSSWMAEAEKWTPSLKVLRFHGPVKERERLKKVASGEIDLQGNMTAKQRAIIRERMTAQGKPIISLDSDSEVDQDSETSVDLVVTTYEAYQSETSWFKRAFVWRYVILDEGHRIKNEITLISKALQGLHAEYRLILTGTPLQNNLGELWALLHWLYPEVFGDKTNEIFTKSFDLTKGLYSNTVLDNARHLLELIMLRRMKTSPGVDLNLPPKTEIRLFVPLAPMQRFWYTRLITRADQGLLDEIFRGAREKEQAVLLEEDAVEASISTDVQVLKSLEHGETMGENWDESKQILKQAIEREKLAQDQPSEQNRSAWQRLMNLLMQLRKVCNHPYQIPNAEPQPFEVGDHIIRASGKFIVLEKLVNELVVIHRKKILIFSSFTRMLDLVEDLLLLRGGDGSLFSYMRLDGSTARARRNLAIRMFNDPSSDHRVMLISTKAGGLGLNLASASDVVLLDQEWNPQITLQAEARAHRIGQTQPVTVYKLLSQGTVEEQMMGRIQKKLFLAAKVMETMEDIHTKAGKGRPKKGRRSIGDDDMPQLDTSQLMALVRRGATAISRPEIDVNEMLSWDWATIVEKCKDQPVDVTVKKDAFADAKFDEEEEIKWLSEMERVEAHIFEGKQLQRGGRGALTNVSIAKEWHRADRRVGKETTVMVDGFAVNKESMACEDWEAVPTMAGKDPRLAEPKRARRPPVIPQSHCQVCLDGGELHCCSLCPRAYHIGCLNDHFKMKAKGSRFVCPQHECIGCGQKAPDAGGMLYRCRWCERSHCEDCLEWDRTILLGNSLQEYQLLDFPNAPQAFYVQCPKCTDHFKEHPDDRAICDRMAAQIEQEYNLQFESRLSPSLAPSLSDGMTIDTPGVSTPLAIDEDVGNTSTRKRKFPGEHENYQGRAKRMK